MADHTSKDLRGSGRDYKRHHDKSHKWENGVSWGPGRQPDHHPRPAKRSNEFSCFYGNPDPKAARNRSMRQDYAEVVTDSSASSADEEDVVPVPAGFGDATHPNADVAYSFDAPSGPSTGSKVLGYAVEKAVERYENKTTDTLVKDEYLVLDEEGEPVSSGRTGKKRGLGKKAGAKSAPGEGSDLDADEDYEFV